MPPRTPPPPTMDTRLPAHPHPYGMYVYPPLISATSGQTSNVFHYFLPIRQILLLVLLDKHYCL